MFVVMYQVVRFLGVISQGGEIRAYRESEAAYSRRPIKGIT
jgi:hypothetical protein